MQPKSIRVTSTDGLFLGPNSSITDGETGNELKGVHRVELTLDVTHRNSAKVFVRTPLVDVRANGELRYTIPSDVAGAVFIVDGKQMKLVPMDEGEHGASEFRTHDPAANQLLADIKKLLERSSPQFES